MRRCTQTLDSSRTPTHRIRSPDREREHFMAETGAAIGITTTTTTVLSLSVASHSLASDTRSDIPMATPATIPTAATTLPLTMAVATMGLVTTAVDITVAGTMAAAIRVPWGRLPQPTPRLRPRDPIGA